MVVLISGGCGFLGTALARRLLAAQTGIRIILSDVVAHPRAAALGADVAFRRADLSSACACREVVTPEVGVVYHFASLVSGGAELDFEAGLQANVHATIHLLEACRLAGNRPRFVFTSSLATFGGERRPAVVDDYTHQHPQTSYGVAKVLGEQLLNDYSRKGYLDGRGVRLPAIVVRDEPNTAASGYASGLIREPLNGRDYGCPVSEEMRIPILSVRRAVELLAKLGELPDGALGDFRTINGPSLAPSAGEIAAAVRRAGVARVGCIAFAPDPAVERMIASWPREMRADRAAALGLQADPSVEALVSEYADSLPAGGSAKTNG